ncbi:MAG: DNA topoisomerase [Bianqueaceae bacterium]
MPEPIFTKRIVDDGKVTDHHALIPTAKRPDLNRLSDDETKIYRLIAKRLLEVFYPIQYEITEAILICQEERFLAKGKVVLEPGYTVLSKKEETTPDKEVDSQPLPPLQKGDIASIAEGAVETKQTKPPNPYTEATLLTAMEYAGKFVEDEELREKMGKLRWERRQRAHRSSNASCRWATLSEKQAIAPDAENGLNRILPNELKS